MYVQEKYASKGEVGRVVYVLSACRARVTRFRGVERADTVKAYGGYLGCRLEAAAGLCTVYQRG